MKTKTLAWIALAIGSLYVLYRYAQSVGSPLLNDLGMLGPSIDPILAGMGITPAAWANLTPGQQRALLADRAGYPDLLPGNTLPAKVASPGIPAAIGAIGAGAGAAVSIAHLFGAGGAAAAAHGSAAGSAAATAGGIGTGATIGITAGIAGGVLLTWAVWKKGLFRGGEEALHVNPDRDQFEKQFIPIHQHLLGPSTGRSDTDMGEVIFWFDHDNTQPLWHAIQNADHIDPFIQAARNIRDFMRVHGVEIQSP